MIFIYLSIHLCPFPKYEGKLPAPGIWHTVLYYTLPLDLCSIKSPSLACPCPPNKLLLLSFWTTLAHPLALFPIIHRFRYVLLMSSYPSGYICPRTCVILGWIVIVHLQFFHALDIELFKDRDNQIFLSFVFKIVSERCSVLSEQRSLDRSLDHIFETLHSRIGDILH